MKKLTLLGIVTALALFAGSNALPQIAYAHNGVFHTEPAYLGVALTARDCAIKHGTTQAQPKLYYTGTLGGNDYYLVDFTPVYVQAFLHHDCDQVMYELFDAIATSKEGLPTHWDDLVALRKAQRISIEQFMATVIARSLYAVADAAKWSPDNQPLGWNEGPSSVDWVHAGSENEARLIKTGQLNPATLALIGSP